MSTSSISSTSTSIPSTPRSFRSATSPAITLSWIALLANSFAFFARPKLV